MKPLLVASALLIAAAPAAAQFVAKEDRFTKRTVLWAPPGDVQIKEAEVTKGLSVGAMTFVTPEVKTPQFVSISFRAYSPNGWQYLKCHRVNALVDGEPIPMERVKHTGNAVYGSLVLEAVSVTVDWEAFVTMTRAKRIEFRVCNTELTVSHARLNDWRALVSAVTP